MPNFNFLAQSNQTDVMIYHSIASGDAAYFIEKIKYISEDHTVNIRINSPGGSVTEGAAMTRIGSLSTARDFRRAVV
ncbi:hypothetical protein Psal182_00536 [Piscirickettsia salmonis]|nr:ATP-dependent Clp protease proteolytic subunit [Piscirickettsia salmonis]QGP38414.1 hypothetical protein Psal182_00536 [Piscirickettsia salmonis]